MRIAKILFGNWSSFLLSVWLMLFSFGQLQRFQITKQVAFYAHDLVIVGFLLVVIFQNNQSIYKKISQFWQKIKTNRLILVWLAWLLGGVIIGAVAGNITLTSLLYLARLIAYSLFLLVVQHQKLTNYSLRQGLAVVSVLMASWGILQYLLLPDTRFLHIFGWDNHYYRLIGTLLDPAFTGMLFVLGFGWWQAVDLFDRLSTNWRKAIQLLFVIAIAATFSRASMVALLVLLLLLLSVRQIKKSFVLLTLLTLIITLMLLPKPGGEGVNLDRTSTAEARLINSQTKLLQLEGGEWLWGRGLFNTSGQSIYETADHAKLPDSLPVLIINASGLGGLILTSLVFYQFFRRWWFADPLWTSLLVATLTHNLFNNTFLQPFIFLALWGSKKD